MPYFPQFQVNKARLKRCTALPLVTAFRCHEYCSSKMCDKSGDDNEGGVPIDFISDERTHWVEKLFPPAFHFSLHDLVSPKTTSTTSKGSQEWDNINSTFEQLSRRILPEDIEAIKNVYHRVWLIMRDQQQRPLDQGTDCQNLATNATGSEKANAAEEAKPEKATKDLSLAETEFSSGTCIWDSADIGILRRVYKDIKEENIRLTSQMKVLEVEMMKLKKLERSKTKELTVRTDELQEAIKANKRLEILSQYLKKELKTSGKVIKDLNETLGELKYANTEMEEEIARMHSELDTERLEKRKLELEWKREIDEITAEHRQHEQGMIENSHKMQVDMVEEMKNLREQLETERELHKRSVRGLNHLRMHFGSLPAAEEKDTDPHQLTKWTSY